VKSMPSSLLPLGIYAVQSFTFGLHSLLTPMTLVTFKTRILYEATVTTPTFYSHLWPLPPPFTFKFWQRVMPPPWRLAGSNKTAAGCWSSFVSFVASFSSVQFCHPCHLSETQLCFQIHSPTLAGSLTTVHSSLILPNAPPCCVCSPLSTRQVASVWAPLDGLC